MSVLRGFRQVFGCFPLRHAFPALFDMPSTVQRCVRCGRSYRLGYDGVLVRVPRKERPYA